ncbi:MAG: rhamnogalacturonan lyase [Fimbriimonadaceae bacterium]|nr:rhamnogalacturonan lyase [Fimbriimonadaceae bacterium]
MGPLSLLLLPFLLAPAAGRQRETLGRGLTAQRVADGVFLSWRLTADDPAALGFRLERRVAGAVVGLTPQPLTGATCWIDREAPGGQPIEYRVTPGDGPGSRCLLAADDPGYRRLPLPPGGVPNDAAAGDLDGDGELEIVLKREVAPHDNSQRAALVPGASTTLEAYNLGGQRLWRIDLGPNIREGAHYTPFLVYDFDGDGRAELAVRTSEGSVDGTGRVIGDVDGDGRTQYANPDTGYILEGPEFLSVFDGRSGAELARCEYIRRGQVSDWGDSYGNRVDRFLMAVAYLDGQRPSVVMCRGYYALTKLAAVDWRDGRLTPRWQFSSADEPHRGYAGQGNHNLSVADVDADGRDEITYGACAIDDDGRGLYTTGLGHGDAMHLSDIDPTRPGLEVFSVHEHKNCPAGMELRDAATGRLLWGVPSTGDVGRGVCMDLDPRHPGYECWAAGGGMSGLYTAGGERIGDARPKSINFGVWWDGDRRRELLDHVGIRKWLYQTGQEQVLFAGETAGLASCNGTKGTPCLSGDLSGDWREEVLWRTADNREVRLYSTPLPTSERRVTLLHDAVYRLSLAHQNVGYNQPPQPGFYLGE